MFPFNTILPGVTICITGLAAQLDPREAPYPGISTSIPKNFFIEFVSVQHYAGQAVTVEMTSALLVVITFKIKFKQEAQLSRRGCAMLHVTAYFATSSKPIQGQSK